MGSPTSKSRAGAYAWWVTGLGGLLGLHRFYLGQQRRGWQQLVTLGGFTVWAARDLIAMERLVDEANDVQRTPSPTFWARSGWRGRWWPIMWRGRFVAATVLVPLVLLVVASSPSLVLSVLVTWLLGVWTFAVGLTLGGWGLPLIAPLLETWHYRLSGRAPGEPLAGIEDHEREAIRVDPIPDETFLPLAAALAIAFRLVELGPAIPLPGPAYQLGLPLVPLATGLLYPALRAPVATALRSVRYNDRGQVSSRRPLGQQLSAYFGLAFVVGALVQGLVARDAGVFTLVFSLAAPILAVQAWYVDDRLARDAHRIEDAIRERIEIPLEAPRTP